MVGLFSTRSRQSGLPATAARSRLCSCGLLLGAALIQPLVLGLPHLGAGYQQKMPEEPVRERGADWKDADYFHLFLLPSDALSALVLNSTSFPCAAPKGVPAKEVSGTYMDLHSIIDDQCCNLPWQRAGSHLVLGVQSTATATTWLPHSRQISGPESLGGHFALGRDIEVWERAATSFG